MLSTQTTPLASWRLSVSAETDAQLRQYLGDQGMKGAELSRFVEEAVRWRMLDESCEAIRQRNADQDPEVLQHLIDQALVAVRQN